MAGIDAARHPVGSTKLFAGKIVAIIKIQDIAYVRYTAPDLDRTQAFLCNFGMVEAGRTDQSLFMRGFGSAPFLHWTQKGESGFSAIGLRAASVDDLKALAAATGAALEALDAPGAGRIVRLVDPDGFTVEVVADQSDAGESEPRQAQAWNSTSGRQRVRSVKRLHKGAAHVERLGHFVLAVGDFRRSEAWYKHLFGFVTSDEVEISPDVPYGAFLRCDRGDEPTDHHAVALIETGTAASFHHAAFEVTDLDDLVVGHDHLISAGSRIDWGIGRHVLGSQVFAYWLDPWGNRLEHWTDGDLLTLEDGSKKVPIEQLHAVQWGTLGRTPDA
ncbi:MAG: glyoxalase [Bradyrhizobium sp.]|nr:glyoxalase [Bradyrhizobium sp.]